MISATKEWLILKLLSVEEDLRLSERKMALSVGVARGTVRNRKAGYRAHSAEALIDAEREVGDVKQKTPRCPECGRALTETPCRACQIEHGLTKPALEIVPSEGV